MKPTETQALLAAINFLINAALLWSCIKRAKPMTGRNTAFSWRARYAVLFGVSFVCGLSPYTLGEWPGVGTVLISLAFLFIVGLGGAWDEVPAYARKVRQPQGTHS